MTAIMPEPSRELKREREIGSPVRLCRPDGSLDPAAVGWSRRPLHDCALPGGWLRRKRWNYWAVTTADRLFAVAVSDLDYAGVVFAYLYDGATAVFRERTVVTPFGRGCRLPDVVDAPVAFAHPRLRVGFDATAGGLDLRVDEPSGFAAVLRVDRPPAHETLNVVVPWDARRFQFTSKQTALPARGTVRLDGRTYEFPAGASWATLDFGRGRWPRHVRWNWGAASGRAGGHTVGLTLGGQWTRGTPCTENALCVDGRLTKISEELAWDYDGAAFRTPWRVRTPASDGIDLTFTPGYERIASTNVVVVRSEVHQCFGRWAGTVRAADGLRLVVDDLFGWAEDHVARW